jgi:hypothetical protein
MNSKPPDFGKPIPKVKIQNSNGKSKLHVSENRNVKFGIDLAFGFWHLEFIFSSSAS